MIVICHSKSFIMTHWSIQAILITLLNTTLSCLSYSMTLLISDCLIRWFIAKCLFTPPSLFPNESANSLWCIASNVTDDLSILRYCLPSHFSDSSLHIPYWTTSGQAELTNLYSESSKGKVSLSLHINDMWNDSTISIWGYAHEQALLGQLFPSFSVTRLSVHLHWLQSLRFVEVVVVSWKLMETN